MGSGEVFLCIILCYYVLCKLKMLDKACFEWTRHSSHAMFSMYTTWVVQNMGSKAYVLWETTGFRV